MNTEQALWGDAINIGITLFMILLNGFFVATEFALVKMTSSKVNLMVKEQRPFASVAAWLFDRQNMALSACQLGITMASLALGWVGEPAVAHLITPLIHTLGIHSASVVHAIAFAIAFSIITSLHIIIGEQVPKIYAIRKPTGVYLWSSSVLKLFYILLYPFMYILNAITMVILKWIGVEEADGHDTPLSEDEIRASLSLAHASGELSKNEHRLLNAVFKFDDEVARHIMVPRSDVEFLDINDSFSENLKRMTGSSHTRFPVCEDSLDKLFGVLHIKDILGHNQEANIDIKSLVRPPMFIPENMPIGHLLQEFRNARQHFAFIQDEHGTILGTVTLEDVLEELVGSMQDEFDNEAPEIVKEAENKYLIDGDVLVETINTKFNAHLAPQDADTLSGLIVEQAGHKLEIGKKVTLSENISAEIIESQGIRATKVRLTINDNENPNKTH